MGKGVLLASGSELFGHVLGNGPRSKTLPLSSALLLICPPPSRACLHPLPPPQIKLLVEPSLPCEHQVAGALGAAFLAAEAREARDLLTTQTGRRQLDFLADELAARGFGVSGEAGAGGQGGPLLGRRECAGAWCAGGSDQV